MTTIEVLPVPPREIARRAPLRDAAVRPRQPRRSRRGAVLVFLPSALLTLALLMSGLGARSMWNDEYATWYASTLSLGDLAKLLADVDAVVAPYYLVMHAWTALAGDSETMLRLPSAVLMGVAAGLIAVIGRRLFDAGVGLTAGLIFAGLPSVSRYGQEARPYAFAIAAAVLAVLLLLRALERPTWRRWLLYGCCLTAAALLHIVTLTMLPAHLLLVRRALRDDGDFRVLRWAAAGSLALTGALPLLAKGSGQTGAISWIRADGQAVAQFPGRLFGSWQVAAVVVAAALVAAALLWSRQRGPVTLLLAWALFPPVFCYLSFPFLHLFLHRYLLFTLPAWALLAGALGHFLVRLSHDNRSVGLSLSAMLVAAAVFSVGGPGQLAARRSPVDGEPDFRSAAAVLTARMRPGDGIAYAGTGRNGRRAFGYETRRSGLPRDVLVARTSQEIGEFGTRECAQPAPCIGTTERIWLVSTTGPYQDPLGGMPEATQAYLRTAFTRADFQSFAGVRLFVLDRRESR
ncbi:glycosyltransferase family 39 protein [Actinoplanes sp. NPDC049599]|uniref:glycosyltransferase family 39 protein n=1 Tax=Actinoplanes sp. NPDC049599 TaxID=3363903 RepID=UPI003790B7B8